MKFYIASRLENHEAVRSLRELLTSMGGQVTYDWTAHLSVQDQGPDRIAEVALDEAAGVREADVVIVLLPGGRGTHTELGIAIGTGRPVFIHGPIAGEDGRECAFYRHGLVIERIPYGPLEALALTVGTWWARERHGRGLLGAGSFRRKEVLSAATDRR